MGEILPGALMELSWDILQEFLDNFLGAIGRSRIDDDPVIDERFNRGKTSFNDVGLVFHDHVETNGFFHRAFSNSSIHFSATFSQVNSLRINSRISFLSS